MIALPSISAGCGLAVWGAVARRCRRTPPSRRPSRAAVVGAGVDRAWRCAPSATLVSLMSVMEFVSLLMVLWSMLCRRPLLLGVDAMVSYVIRPFGDRQGVPSSTPCFFSSAGHGFAAWGAVVRRRRRTPPSMRPSRAAAVGAGVGRAWRCAPSVISLPSSTIMLVFVWEVTMGLVVCFSIVSLATSSISV